LSTVRSHFGRLGLRADVGLGLYAACSLHSFDTIALVEIILRLMGCASAVLVHELTSYCKLLGMAGSASEVGLNYEAVAVLHENGR